LRSIVNCRSGESLTIFSCKSCFQTL
jgi:hypothetical protein